MVEICISITLAKMCRMMNSMIRPVSLCDHILQSTVNIIFPKAQSSVWPRKLTHRAVLIFKVFCSLFLAWLVLPLSGNEQMASIFLVIRKLGGSYQVFSTDFTPINCIMWNCSGKTGPQYPLYSICNWPLRQHYLALITNYLITVGRASQN